VGEVMISFERPASMTESEMRAWVTERGRVRRSERCSGADGGASREALLLCVDVQADSKTAEEQLTDLMMDMRLLGLRPNVVSGEISRR
jgi:hypothetical protein